MPKKPMPQFIEPMQASSVKDSFDSPDWIFETKLDGYRAIAVVDSDGKARIWSRNHLPLEPKFPTVLDSVNKTKLAIHNPRRRNRGVRCGRNLTLPIAPTVAKATHCSSCFFSFGSALEPLS